jgi:hypothetical protein
VRYREYVDLQWLKTVYMPRWVSNADLDIILFGLRNRVFIKPQIRTGTLRFSESFPVESWDIVNAALFYNEYVDRFSHGAMRIAVDFNEEPRAVEFVLACVLQRTSPREYRVHYRISDKTSSVQTLAKIPVPQAHRQADEHRIPSQMRIAVPQSDYDIILESEEGIMSGYKTFFINIELVKQVLPQPVQGDVG